MLFLSDGTMYDFFFSFTFYFIPKTNIFIWKKEHSKAKSDSSVCVSVVLAVTEMKS